MVIDKMQTVTIAYLTVALAYENPRCPRGVLVLYMGMRGGQRGPRPRDRRLFFLFQTSKFSSFTRSLQVLVHSPHKLDRNLIVIC